MVRKKTHEEFVKDLNKVHGERVYIPLEKYINARAKILVRHSKCGYEWKVQPNSLLRGQGCPKCNGGIKKTHEEFVKEVYDKYGNEYEILGKYVNDSTKILVRHNSRKCKFHEYEVTPSNLLQGRICPVCLGREAKLGINTIWDTDRWMVDLGVSEDDAKKYSHGSGQRIMVKCPDCGREKEIVISTIYIYKSIGCSCGDGKSYPEKFVVNLLEQLNIDFETEYSPKWIKPKRYDFYIKDLNMIIETHGKQHYSSKTSFKNCGGRTLEEEQINDKFKKEVALKNGIKRYIELDCRESNMEWIKNSILHSELANLFDLSKVNWTNCAEFANKNIVKEVCEYWNNGIKSTIKIGKIMKLTSTTIREYLKQGKINNWCNYDPKEEMRKHGIKAGGYNKKKVEIFKNGKNLGIFNSCVELERESEELFGVKLLRSQISNVCNEKRKIHKGFTFKYVEEDNENKLNILDIS